MKGRESAMKKPEKHHSLRWVVWCKTVSHGDICSVSSLPGSLGTSVERRWNILMKGLNMTCRRNIFPYSKQENNHLASPVDELYWNWWCRAGNKLNKMKDICRINNNNSTAFPIVYFQKQHAPNFYGRYFLWFVKYENINMDISLNPGNNTRTHTSQWLTYLSILVVLFLYLVFHYLNGTKYSHIFIEFNSLVILAFAAIQQ